MAVSEHRKKYLRDWLKRNPEKRFMRYWRARLKAKYGMTPKDYLLLLKVQGGLCLICARELKIANPSDRVRDGGSAVVDHNHKTGRVRSILCNNCNRALGLLDHDPQILKRATRYLEIMDEDKHQNFVEFFSRDWEPPTVDDDDYIDYQRGAMLLKELANG